MSELQHLLGFDGLSSEDADEWAFFLSFTFAAIAGTITYLALKRIDIWLVKLRGTP